MTRLTKRVRITQAASQRQFNKHLEVMMEDPLFVEGFKQRFLEAATTSYDEDRDLAQGGFRRLSASRRDISPLKFDKAMQLSFYQWQRNPLAKTMIRILVDFCVGDELAVKVKIKKRSPGTEDEDTKRPDAQKVWDDFFADPVNNLENELPNFLQDLFLNGELIVPVNTNRERKKTEGGQAELYGNGKVRLGYLDPLNVKRTKTDPKNIRQITDIILTPPESTEEFTLAVIHVDTDPNSKTFDKRVGETFYWRINYVTNQTRGNGELVPLLDWLDALDQFLFDALEGFRLRNAFFYQLEMQGKTQKELDAMKIKTPKTGTVKLVNDKAKWTAIAPELQSNDVNQAFKTLLSYVVGVGKTFPPHWFGVGEDANLATAKVMSVPTMRMLRSTQKVARQILKDMVYYVTDQAILAKVLKLDSSEYVECDISMFDFEKSDSSVVSTAMVQLVNALVVAVDNNWISRETARKVIQGFVTRLGVEIDADAEAKLTELEDDPDVAAAQKMIDEAKKRAKEKDGKPEPALLED